MSALSPKPVDDCFTEDLHGVTYREAAAPLAGLLISLFGLASLGVSAAFLMEMPSWPRNGGTVIAVLAVVACAGFGCGAVALAVAAFRPQLVRFDGGTRRVHGRVRGRLWLHRSIDADASTFGRPFIQVSAREAGSDLHEVRIPRPGHTPLMLGAFEDPATARHWQDRLTTLLNQ